MRSLRLWTVLLTAWAIAVLGLDMSVAAAAEERTLQQMIDLTPSGQMLRLEAGTYDGPIVIEHAMTIEADGRVIIRSDGEEPLVMIRADEVQVKGIELHDERLYSKTAAFFITGDRHVIEDVSVWTSGAGIRLEGANDNILDGISIEGRGADGAQHLAAGRGHGIDLWESSRNTITNNRISYMLDGIYIERSHGNVIADNDVTHSRYGYHFMFSDDNELIDNSASFNISGAMIMGVKRSTVMGNVLTNQTESTNALGLLLYNTYDTYVAHNELADNRIGMFAEYAGDNVIEHNELLRNFIGLQMLGAAGNVFRHNNFVANVVQAQAQDSADNVIEANYWDDMQGIDLDGEGWSSLPYFVNPFFMTIAETTPAFQIFFASPSMQFLEALLHSPSERWFQDVRPAMAPIVTPSDERQRHGATAVIGGILLLGSIYIIRLSGVRRR